MLFNLARHKGAQLSLAIIVAGSLGLGGIVGATPAAAATETEASVGIRLASDSPRASGMPFTYDIDFSCDQLGGGTGNEASACTDTVITIPLTDSLKALLPELEIGIGTSDYIESVDIIDGQVIFRLGAVPVGESLQFQLDITPPNFTTPNNTDWSLLPTATGSNFNPAVAEKPAVGQATSGLTHGITKSVNDSAFVEPGELVSYTITVSCTRSATGMILADSMVVTDSMPAGLTYVSSTPAAAVGAGGTLTWNLAGGTLPTACSAVDGDGTASFVVEAKVADDAAYGSKITNTATVDSVTTDGQVVAQKQSQAGLTVVGDGEYPVGTFSKDSFAQLRDGDAPASSRASGLETDSHTTYPGNWLGAANVASGDWLRNYTPNQDSGMKQAGYKMQYWSGVPSGAGFQLDITDPVPCLTNRTEQIYGSQAVGEYCAAPAFHVKTVTVHTDGSGGVPNLTNAYVPKIRYADGTLVDMVRTSGGDHYGNYSIPDLKRMDVAELMFPRDAGLSGPVIRWAVFGFVDPRAEENTIVHNEASAKVYWKDESTLRAQPKDSADLYVINAPQIGIEKSFGKLNATGPGTTSMKLTARLSNFGTSTEDFVVTDLLPQGMKIRSTDKNSTVATTVEGDSTRVTHELTPTTEVLNNFEGTGRQLVRVTVPKAQLEAYGSLQVTMVSEFTVEYINEPGTYANVAQVYFTDEALLKTCQQSPAYLQSNTEAIDLNGNGSLSDATCYSTANLVVPPPTGGASFKTTKTVQGAEDAAPKAYPGVGIVGTKGGSVTFGLGWKNTGGVPLKGAVIYDVFPVPGDQGVGGTVAGKPRNSQFQATYVSLGELPENVTVEYSEEANPCRNEVFPDAKNAGCIDDWSSTAPTDPSTITAIRLVSSATYAPGEGFAANVIMTVPPIVEGQIAWNSIAGAAVKLDGGALNPNSPPKVGITATSSGIPLLLAKTLNEDIDPTTVKPGDTLIYTVSVSNPDAVQRTITGTDTLPAGLKFDSVIGLNGAALAGVDYDEATNTINWAGVPIESGATLAWRVTATVQPGVTGNQTNTWKVDGGTGTENPCLDDPSAECVPVEVLAAGLTITKVVDGAGSEFANTTFTAHLVCAVGDEIILDEDAVLAADGSVVSFAVPYGATCEVTEPHAGGATASAITPSGAFAIVTSNAEYAATVTNTFEAGGLVINKQLTGSGAEAFGAGQFTFAVACTFNDQQVFADEVTLQREGDETVLESEALAPLPIGAECTVTETDAGGADALPEPVTVTVVQDEELANIVTATIVNEFSAGTVRVTKELDGAEASLHAEDTFTVLVTCQVEVPSAEGNAVRGTVASQSIQIVGGETVVLANDEGQPIALPLGSHCFATETDAGDATGSSVNFDSYENAIVVDTGSPERAQELAISVINTFDPAPEPVLPPDDGVANKPAPGLAVTGAPASTSLAVVGLVLMVLGALALRRRRA
ncbi:DUF5979 domain-containing protein [Lysinibacter cavernae]|uniref:Fimbrial isopeptide formation D2 family protein/uncharacterized repeat protein (TIGR01451 family) n=1 Tax=Lysinibacter cavernae TaxID=1640652 RepID=A0A7X5R3Y0_9MICO|nr:DUF5979 domain-containing protein [Lysinibacter cavernae]NIH55215.1 fimbrial isopeptide formation D2 family protein/uncharacterized repeat protein (TIGR01451 family) [Lysinibacter cavernae]